jgi:hypothetical protein
MAGIFLAGCNSSDAPAGASGVDPVGGVQKGQYLLSKEPAGAKAVKEVRQEAKDGDGVVVVGRVGGSPKPFVEGRAAFTLVDPSLISCGEREGDTCSTPWDFCCETKEDLARATLMVKFVDERGKTLPEDAQALLGLKPLETVVVQGQAKRDGDGNLIVLASGLYVRPPAASEAKP